MARQARGVRRPSDERGLGTQAANHLVYLRWKDRPPSEVLARHRRVRADILLALRDAPDARFADRERRADWPVDLDRNAGRKPTPAATSLAVLTESVSGAPARGSSLLVWSPLWAHPLAGAKDQRLSPER